MKEQETSVALAGDQESPGIPNRGLPPSLENPSRDALLAYFDDTWSLSDWLMFSITGEGAFYEVADDLRHPLIFYLGHTAVFYINKLVACEALERINPHFESLFEMGIDPEKPSEVRRQISWPKLAEVWDYRQKARSKVRDWLQTVAFPERIDSSDPLWALFMGLEHDRIHFETSSVLIRQYPTSYLTRPEGWHYAPVRSSEPVERMISFPSGSVRLGKPHDFPTYGWDNEYGKLRVQVPAFETSNNLVTNGQFMDFVDDGGYLNPEHWSREGWQWVRKDNVSHPKFWVPTSEGFSYRAMFDVLDMPQHWPAEVNALEAEAYCRWRGNGFRLLSEGEFGRIAADLELGDEDVVARDDFNNHLCYGSPCPVGSLESATSARGVNDVFGNVWVWLSDLFRPLPGFEIHPLYDNFSEPYFGSKHNMMLGGSWATTGLGTSRFYRLWFRRNFFQHAGFRLARSLD